MNFLDFLHKNTILEKIKWDYKNTAYYSKVGNEIIIISEDCDITIGRIHPNLDRTCKKIVCLIFDFISNDERYYEKIVSNFNKSLEK